MYCTIRNATKLSSDLFALGNTSKKALGLLCSDVRPIKPARHDLRHVKRSITSGRPRLFD